MKKILFVCPYPYQEAPSQRFRYEQYLEELSRQNFLWVIKPFFSKRAYRTIKHSKNEFSKVICVLSGYLRRLILLFSIHQFDFVFIHREVMPVGPPVAEWFIAKVLGKKMIYDFDDAIWLTDKARESPLQKLIRWRGKVRQICRWSYKVSAGNEYLAAYARQFSTDVIVNPTTIDTQSVHLPRAGNRTLKQPVVIGWTGSHSTLKYLERITPVLQLLEEKLKTISFHVVADQEPTLPLQNLIFKKWSPETEIEDLAQFDIGIMPLPDDEWTNGKCGFKALQYLAMEIPAIVSPVGVNTKIVLQGINGFCCATEAEWLAALEQLILNDQLRHSMGQMGREQVIKNYSVLSNTPNFLSLFQ